MKLINFKIANDEPDDIAKLVTIDIRGRTFGVAKLNIRLFGCETDAFAVARFGQDTNYEKWISTKMCCFVWLKERGLSTDEAHLLLEIGERLYGLNEVYEKMELALQKSDAEDEAARKKRRSESSKKGNATRKRKKLTLDRTKGC